MSRLSFRILGSSLVLAVTFGLSGPAMGAASCCGQDMADLSREKKELAGKLYEEFRSGTLEVRRDLLARRRALDAELCSAQYDEQKIQSLAEEIAELRARLHSARVALKSALIKEGIPFGYSGYGPGMGRGCCAFGGGCQGMGHSGR
jgi:Spy/CpxP family protein refolding chaperone